MAIHNDEDASTPYASVSLLNGRSNASPCVQSDQDSVAEFAGRSTVHSHDRGDRTMGNRFIVLTDDPSSLVSVMCFLDAMSMNTDRQNRLSDGNRLH